MQLAVSRSKFTVAVLFLLTLPLFGWGCESEKSVIPPPQSQDAIKTSDVSETPKVPEGWKVYKSERLQLSFAYPDNWYVLEDEKLGILVSDFQLPLTLPPNMGIDVPIVISRSDAEEQQLLAALYEEDPSATVEDVKVNNYSGKRYQYKAGPDDRPVVSYRFFDETQFVTVSADASLQSSLVQNILNTLSF